MYRLSQNSRDVVVQPVPMMLKDGTQATSLNVNSFTTTIIKPDGTALVDFTTPVITNPNSVGVYSAKFPTTANSKVFIEVDQGNPYAVTLDHIETDVEPMTAPVWISDRLQGDLALQSYVNSIASQVDSTYNAVVSNVATQVDLIGITESKVRIEAGDTHQFIRNFGTVPNSVSVSIYDPAETVVVSLATASQSGGTANFYYFHTTDINSHHTTVDSSGEFILKWTVYRGTGNDIEKEYFEVVKTDKGE